MRPPAVLLASLALASPLAAQQAPLDGFDAYVAKAVRDWNIPGLAIAVVKDGQVVFAKGYGVRELGKPEPVDTNTRFSIGSTTKAMTTASLAMLVDEGKVKWDDPVTKYVPELQLQDPVMTRELTVRDLLTHHTGIGNTDFLWLDGELTPAEIFHRLRFVKPSSFRSRYEYQNVQYALAGAVIAKASGMPWADFVRTRIFQPLDMRGTLPLDAMVKGQPDVATPHAIIDDTLRAIAMRSVDPVASAGSVWSSVADMSKWMRFILDSGRVNGKRLIAEDTFHELLTPQVIVRDEDFYPTTTLTHPHVVAYALGWFLEDYAGSAVAMHTGSIDGLSAIIGLIPDERLGVYVLANGDHAELRHALMYTVFDRFNGRRDHDWSKEMKALYDGIEARGRERRAATIAARVPGTKPTLPLARYAGTYVDSLYGEATVTSDGDGLRVHMGKGQDAKLEHWHYDTFLARWEDRRNGESYLTFGLNARGEPATLSVDGGSMILRRRPANASVGAGRP
jgi:CubicO group peptidase (beta-lactamase class C family)